MVTPIVAGLGVAAVALTTREALLAYQAWKLAPRKFYEGGFQAQMDRSEALRILAIRDSGSKEKVMEAWKKVLQANHPDQGGSDYIAAKVNEAKDILLGKGGKGGGPGF